MIQEISTFKSGLHLLANQIATAVCMARRCPSHGFSHFHPIPFPGNTRTHTGGEIETTVHYSALLSHSKKLRVKQATCEKCIFSR